RHTSFSRDWSSDVCSSDLLAGLDVRGRGAVGGSGAASGAAERADDPPRAVRAGPVPAGSGMLAGQIGPARAGDAPASGACQCGLVGPAYQRTGVPMTAGRAAPGGVVLDIRDLRVSFRQDGKVIDAVKGVGFTVAKGETVALVGESGSGKSVTALSTVALLGQNAEIAGSVTYLGREMVGADEATVRDVRGNDISFIFQEPMTSLNPLHTLEKQLAESLALHQGLAGPAVRARIVELLEKVGIDNPERRLADYPHQLSGGQRQRVMIAMALANGPELLIADEPTTALDVTIQSQILDLLAELKARESLSMLFISHDLGIVRRIADRVCVMQGGEIVEQGPVAEIF